MMSHLVVDSITLIRPSEQGREPTTNSTHMAPDPGFELGPHRFEASALTLQAIPALGSRHIVKLRLNFSCLLKFGLAK